MYPVHTGSIIHSSEADAIYLNVSFSLLYLNMGLDPC